LNKKIMKRITQILRPATMASLFFVAFNASAVPILTDDAVVTDTQMIVGTMYDGDLTTSAYLVTTRAYRGGTTVVTGGTGTSSSNVSLSEPSTLGMFAIGLGLAIGFRRWPKAA
jgi:hypothetical protein